MHKNIVHPLLYVALVTITALALGGVRDLGVRDGPAFLLVLVVPCVLIGLARFPAAFIVPVLFAPQDRPLPLIPVQSQEGVTTLAAAIALLCAAILFRLAVLSTRRPSGLSELFKSQKRGLITYLLFAVVIAISYTYTHAPNYGGDKLLRFLTIGSLCFLSPFVLLREEKDFRHFALAILGLALVVSAVQVLTTSHGDFGKGERVTHIGVGQVIGMAILLVLSFRFFEARAARFLIWLSLPCLAVGLVAAESRGPLFSLLLVCLLFSFIHPPNSKPLTSYRVLMLGAITGLALLVMIPPSWLEGKAATMLAFKEGELVTLMEGRDSKGSGGKRLVYYKAALVGISERPALGWGVGGWSSYDHYTDDRHYPHDLVLEVGFEEGLLGVAALGALLLTALGAAKKVFLEGGERYVFLLPLLIYSFGVTLTSGDIDDNRFLWFWCGVALATCAMMKLRARELQPVQTLES